MKKITFIILSSILLFSCRKEEDGIVDGPNLNDLFGPFAILTDIAPNQNTVNFSDGEEIFWNGTLSKNTDWVIRLEGQNSGAVRTITGSNQIISLDNSTWLGGANTFPGFSLEDVDVTISFPQETSVEPLTDVITITGLKIETGLQITNFEDGAGNNCEIFNQTTVSAGIICGDGQAASGDCYYSISGVVGWDWAIGSVAICPESGSFDLQNSASNLFFNMGFRAVDNFGPGNSFVLLWFDEDDNEDGVFDPNTEDRIAYEYWSEDDQWDLISLNYADLQFDALGNQIETNGNGLMEPSKLISINLFFLANPEGGLSTGYFDQVIFTTDGPYLP